MSSRELEKFDSFFALIKAGLWEKESRLSLYDNVNWQVVYQLAQEQSVLGLVLAGVEHSDIKPPQDELLQWIGEIQIVEQQNKAMNEFIAILMEKFRNIGVYALLVKGQGIAQCYERPLWRLSGDVDLLLSRDNYYKSKEWLDDIGVVTEEELQYKKHITYRVDDWDVEIHGTLRGEVNARIDNMIDEVQDAVFFGGSVRSWVNGKTQIFLPSVNEDVVFVFTHILQHFFRAGIGLRQICDWCRLLWTYKDSLDHELLESRIRKAGIMSEWKAFGAFAVEYLGMPVEAMPMYSTNKKWSRKAYKICSYVMDVGNFGHNRDMSYKSQSPFFKRMTISLKYRTSDFVKQVMVFPVDAVRAYWYIWGTGLKVVAKRTLSKI